MAPKAHTVKNRIVVCRVGEVLYQSFGGVPNGAITESVVISKELH